MKTFRLLIALSFVLVGIPEVMAQIPPPNPPAAETPLDGFSGALLLAGMAYAARRSSIKKG